MIYPSMTVFMQRVQMSSARGYYYYITGKIDHLRFEELSKRFQTFYSICDSKFSRHRRRNRGEAAAVLHAFRQCDTVHYTLMATTGKGKIHEREKLSDLRQKSSRLSSPCATFVLIHDGKSWSWSLSKQEYNKWRERIHRVAALRPERRKQFLGADGSPRDFHVEKLLNSLYSLPGFRRIRMQIGELVVYLQLEWVRLRPSNGPRPTQRTFLHYLRILPVREKSVNEKMAVNAKKRARVNGQTVEERTELAREKWTFAEKRRRFRHALKLHHAKLE